MYIYIYIHIYIERERYDYTVSYFFLPYADRPHGGRSRARGAWSPGIINDNKNDYDNDSSVNDDNKDNSSVNDSSVNDSSVNNIINDNKYGYDHLLP